MNYPTIANTPTGPAVGLTGIRRGLVYVSTPVTVLFIVTGSLMISRLFGIISGI